MLDKALWESMRARARERKKIDSKSWRESVSMCVFDFVCMLWSSVRLNIFHRIYWYTICICSNSSFSLSHLQIFLSSIICVCFCAFWSCLWKSLFHTSQHGRSSVHQAMPLDPWNASCHQSIGPALNVPKYKHEPHTHPTIYIYLYIFMYSYMEPI